MKTARSSLCLCHGNRDEQAGRLWRDGRQVVHGDDSRRVARQLSGCRVIGSLGACRSRVSQAAAERHAGCHRRARPVGHRATIGRPVRRGFRTGAEAMIVPFSCRQSAAPPRSVRAFPGSAVVSGVSIGCIEPLDYDFVGKRSAAYSRKEGRAMRGGVQEPTDRGQVKSPCHAGIQAAVAACLLAGRPVGRWQVARLFPTISGFRPAQCRSRPAVHLRGAAR